MVTATDRHTARVADLHQAAGLTPADVSEQVHRIIDWLAGWDNFTHEGIVELVERARRSSPCVCPEGDTLALCRVHGLSYDREGNLTAVAREVVATVATRTDPVMGDLAAAADEWDWALVPRDRIDALAETLGGS